MNSTIATTETLGRLVDENGMADIIAILGNVADDRQWPGVAAVLNQLAQDIGTEIEARSATK